MYNFNQTFGRQLFEIDQFYVIKIIKMNQQQKKDHIHRHFHYHYHYDVPEGLPASLQDSYSRQVKTPRHSQLTNDYSSWKKHINPQVTRLYQQMKDYHPLQQTADSQFFNNHRRMPQSYENSRQQINESNYLTQSRRKLIQDIEKHVEYLKNRKEYNIITPNTVSSIKLRYPDNNQDKKHLITKKFNRQSQSLDDFIRKNSDSRIFDSDKTQKSTAAWNEEIQTCSGSCLNPMKKSQRKQNLIARSEIKSPKSHFYIDHPKMGFSHIKAKHNESKSNQSTCNFSLNQRQTQQKKLHERTAAQLNTYQQQTNQVIKSVQSTQFCLKKNHKEDEIYRYELMKEECEYLRNKFIEHIGIIHGTKFQFPINLRNSW